VNGFAKRCWSEVSPGEPLDELVLEVSATTLAMAVAGTGDFYPLHHDRDFARANGARDAFLNTMWYQGLLGRVATDWGGPESFIRRMSVKMRAPSCPGDTLTVTGSVTRAYNGDGRRLVDLELAIHNQLARDAVTADLTLELP
jgi:acyl dehydratase